MTVINPLQYRKYDDLQAGELLILSLPVGPSLGLLLEKQDEDSLILGLLRGHGSDEPVVYVTSERLACLSYGLHWVVELQPTPHTVRGQFSASSMLSGEAILDSDEAKLTFATGSMPRHVLTFGLHTRTRGNLPSSGARGFNWSIWSSSEERLRPTAEPIFRFQPDSFPRA